MLWPLMAVSRWMVGQTVLHQRSEAALQVCSKERRGRLVLLASLLCLYLRGSQTLLATMGSRREHVTLPDAPYLLSGLRVAKS